MKSKAIGALLVECRIHWIRYLSTWAAAGLFVIGALAYFFSGDASGGFILLLGAAVLVFPAVYNVSANCIILTDKMVYSKKGWLRTSEMSAPLDKIHNIAIDSGILGKCFGYATVRIDTVSGVYTLSGVMNANELREKFFELR